MMSLQQVCERPLPTSTRIELFCRVLEAIDGAARRKTPFARLDAKAILLDGAKVVLPGPDPTQPRAGTDAVEFFHIVEVVFGVRTGRLLVESAPGTPWVLEHIVARLRGGDAPAPAILLAALKPWRVHPADAPVALDDVAAAAVRRRDAIALIARATELGASSGPGEAVLWALDEAALIDPDFADPRDRRNRVAQSAKIDVASLRFDVLSAMDKVLRTKDRTAAARVAAVLFGAGADPERVLEPLVTRPQLVKVEPPRSSSTAWAAAVGIFVCAIVASWFFVGSDVDDVAVVVEAPTAVPAVEPTPTPPATPQAAPTKPAQQRTGIGGPAIVNVWLEGCADCMPTFNAWLLVAGSLPKDARVVNVAYGAERPSTRDFATRYAVGQNLRFDVDGSLIVQPTGTGTFTTFIIGAAGEVVWRGRAVDVGFLDSLKSAWITMPAVPSSNSDGRGNR